jgi:hypothetical protein
MDRLSSYLLVALLVFPASAWADDAADTLFELKIRPVLVNDCLPCHGGKKTNSGLKVDSREAMLKGGDRGPAIVAGDPEHSLLIDAIDQIDDDLKMPPERRLTDEVRAAFRRWIADGANWPKVARKSHVAEEATSGRHWAFEKVERIEPPLDPSHWSERPIDRFITAKQRAAGVSHVGPAGKRTLIRRVTFDLIGLPPRPDEVVEFVSDRSAVAFSRVVERLLASPHYGERWGRHWMDVVRYADTAGDNADYPVPEAALYRNYIIDSFNKDKPFDCFVREQLAGDVLAKQGPTDHYADSIIATGFLALSRRYATAPFELWHLTLEDAIETTGRAFLGLTLRCARCHDHKFDPVTQRDYYGLYGVFASTTFPYAGSEEFQSQKLPRMNFVPLLEPRRAEPTLNAYRLRIAELERKVQSLVSTKDPKEKQGVSALSAELFALKRASLPDNLPGGYAVTEGPSVDVAIQRRGDPATPGAVVPRGVPRFDFLAANPPTAVPAQSSGRLELANWLTHPAHPLMARVMVNRIWQHHFGRGIVATPSNFGVRGEPPTHPELLDWLASRFVESGWSIKDIHREIVMSRTYQLASDLETRDDSRDPANRLLDHFPRRRLDAESIRDAMLAVSGQLDSQRPQSHPFPPIDAWHWTQHDAFKAVYATNHRSVYLMTQRLVKHPYLAIFDGPDTNASTDVRTHSTVPLQALYLMNNPFVQEQARGFANRLIASSTDRVVRIELAYELAWGRTPEPSEIERAIRFLHQTLAALTTNGTPRDSAESDAWTSLAKVLLTANEFLYID